MARRKRTNSSWLFPNWLWGKTISHHYRISKTQGITIRTSVIGEILNSLFMTPLLALIVKANPKATLAIAKKFYYDADGVQKVLQNQLEIDKAKADGREIIVSTEQPRQYQAKYEDSYVYLSVKQRVEAAELRLKHAAKKQEDNHEQYLNDALEAVVLNARHDLERALKFQEEMDEQFGDKNKSDNDYAKSEGKQITEKMSTDENLCFDSIYWERERLALLSEHRELQEYDKSQAEAESQDDEQNDLSDDLDDITDAMDEILDASSDEIDSESEALELEYADVDAEYDKLQDEARTGVVNVRLAEYDKKLSEHNEKMERHNALIEKCRTLYK